MLAKAMEVAHEHACSLNVTREITSQQTNHNLSSYSCKKKKKKKHPSRSRQPKQTRERNQGADICMYFLLFKRESENKIHRIAGQLMAKAPKRVSKYIILHSKYF